LRPLCRVAAINTEQKRPIENNREAGAARKLDALSTVRPTRGQSYEYAGTAADRRTFTSTRRRSDAGSGAAKRDNGRRGLFLGAFAADVTFVVYGAARGLI